MFGAQARLLIFHAVSSFDDECYKTKGRVLESIPECSRLLQLAQKMNPRSQNQESPNPWPWLCNDHTCSLEWDMPHLSVIVNPWQAFFLKIPWSEELDKCILPAVGNVLLEIRFFQRNDRSSRCRQHQSKQANDSEPRHSPTPTQGDTSILRFTPE